VAETVGADAVPDPDLDWVRYGPELANVLLTERLATASSGASGAQHVPAVPRPRLSDALASAIGNPVLRHHLGLDSPASETSDLQA
jgi:hypothetical protein